LQYRAGSGIIVTRQGNYRDVTSESSDAISLRAMESRRPRTRYMADRNTEGSDADGPPPGAAGLCRSGRRLREMLPPDAPGYLLPIVEALMSEQTDEAACRSLGISPRTFSRRVAELLGHLDVTTRFQGGAELVRRGCRDCFWRDEGRPRP
jgi:hypothetical protein